MNRTLFEEVQKLSNESHDKWFERYFKKIDLEKKIKQAAQEGFSGYSISITKCRDDYTRRRLEDYRTLIKLKEMLGEDFKVDFDSSKGSFLPDKKISITWGRSQEEEV